MAFKQTLIHRMFTLCNNKFSTQTLRTCRISPSTSSFTDIFTPPNPDTVAPDPGDSSFFNRFVRSRSDNMIQQLKQMDSVRNRIRLDGISHPPMDKSPEKVEMTVADAKKILRVSQIEKLKTKLRAYREDNISYDEFVNICVDECLNLDQGLDLAKVLDDSGSVIVLGNVVFLKPEQVVKAIQCLLPKNLPATRNPPLKELEEMERWKFAIDTKARKMVQRELWGGLVYLVVQTAGFLRLTFWELSWDVMEPICFCVTSMYFMGGYAFFLRTAKEPSFEGFFQSRFSSKQKKLMKRQGFDMEKYTELREACYPYQEEWPSESSPLDGGARKSFT